MVPMKDVDVRVGAEVAYVKEATRPGVGDERVELLPTRLALSGPEVRRGPGVLPSLGASGVHEEVRVAPVIERLRFTRARLSRISAASRSAYTHQSR
jgi:hypothetical protein